MSARQMGRWQVQVNASGAPVALVPMSAAAAAAIALQYNGELNDLPALLSAAGVTAAVIPKGIDAPLWLSLTAHLVQNAGASDVALVDLYAVSHTAFGTGKPGLLLERMGVATFKADGAAVIANVGIEVDPVASYYPATVTLDSDLLTEARTKVALDCVSGRTPATVEITDPGESVAILAVAHAHATLPSAATVGLVWRVWE